MKSIYKYTSDDWYPAFEMPCVEVKLQPISDGSHRVSVWGADDFGMFKDFETQTQARSMFAIIQRLTDVKQKDLKKLGFERY